jgi:hypothetical protein
MAGVARFDGEANWNRHMKHYVEGHAAFQETRSRFRDIRK